MNTLRAHEMWRKATAIVAAIAGSLTLTLALDSKKEVGHTPSQPKVTKYDGALAFIKSARLPNQLFGLSDRPGYRGLDADIFCDSEVDQQGLYRAHSASYTDKQHPVLFPLVGGQESNYIRANEMMTNVLPQPEFIGVDVVGIKTDGHKVTINPNLVSAPNHSQPAYDLDNGAIVEKDLGALHYVIAKQAGQVVVAAACNDILAARNEFVTGEKLAEFHNSWMQVGLVPFAPTDSVLTPG